MVPGFRSSRLVKCRIISADVLAGTEITGGGGGGGLYIYGAIAYFSEPVLSNM